MKRRGSIVAVAAGVLLSASVAHAQQANDATERECQARYGDTCENVAAFLHATGAVAAKANATAAQDIPRFNSDANCRRDFGFNPVRVNHCLEDEKEGLDYLRSVWAGVPQKIKAACTPRIVDPNKTYGYHVLSTCISGAMESWQANAH
jgi:hypothetical protein